MWSGTAVISWALQNEQVTKVGFSSIDLQSKVVVRVLNNQARGGMLGLNGVLGGFEVEGFNVGTNQCWKSNNRSPLVLILLGKTRSGSHPQKRGIVWRLMRREDFKSLDSHPNFLVQQVASNFINLTPSNEPHSFYEPLDFILTIQFFVFNKC